MDVFLLRHGEAEDIGSRAKTDFERALTREGVKLMEEEAQGMKRLGLRFNAILSSPLIRAKQTAEIVSEVLDSRKITLCDALAIPVSTLDLMNAFKPFQPDYKVLLVGHMNDIGRLAGYFTGDPKLILPFKKGSLCRIEITRLLPVPSGELRWFVTSRQLKLIGQS